MSDQDDSDYQPDANEEDDPDDDELVDPLVVEENDPDDGPEQVPPPLPGADRPDNPVESPAVNAFSVDGFAIEGVEGINATHARSFYELLIPMMQKAGPSWKLGTRQKFDSIMDALVRVRNGESIAQVRETYAQAYKWRKSYALVKNGVGGFLIVERPENAFGLNRNGEDIDVDVDSVVQLTYLEAAYSNINKCHLPDHTKGRTLHARVCRSYSNIARNLTKLYTETCPICIAREVRNKPPAGVRPILTVGFGTRGQVDLIDFQSLPNGDFKYLLNYIDHGIKFLFSIPLKFKRASCIAYALLEIFTIIGPPMILQSDNGREFLQAAMTRRQRDEYSGKLIALTKLDLTKIIVNIRELWPDCRMVRGSPRHSPSNGGVERVNRTVEEKLGAWMRETRNTNWSVGCRIIMWRYNTQLHGTIKQLPYECMFGQVPRVGISSLPLDPSVLDTLSTEAQLNRVSEYNGKVDVEDDANNSDLDEAASDEVCGIDVDEMDVDVDVFEDGVHTPVEEAMSPSVSGNGNVNMDEDELSDTPVAIVVNNIDEDPLEAWFGAVEAMDKNEFVDLEYLSDLALRESVPIAWCVDTRDVHEVRSFVPAYLLRVSKNMWEVTDVDDMVLRNLDWMGDEGIDNMMGIYIQHPAKRFLEYFKEKRPLATLTAANTRAASLAVSPRRSALRKRAAENIAKSASKMKARAITKSGENNFDVGNVVKVALADVDRAKTDPQNLTGVIVNVNPKTMTARVAVKSGVLKNWYAYHKLSLVTESGNNVELLGLRDALVGWSMMATITEREAARDQSMVGGQGKGGVICSCKSACQTRACSCFKAGRRCSSACHRNNHKCRNHDKDANDDANDDDK